MVEQEIEMLMKLLDISREEALDVIESDRKIDKGEKLFELSDDQKKAEKKMRAGAKAVNAYGRTVVRERKIDDDKRILIETIKNALPGTDIEVTNLEREIVFKYNNRKFKVVLSAPRS